MNIDKVKQTVQHIIRGINPILLTSVAIGLLAFSGNSHADTVKYEIDPAHSSVGFRIKHLLSWIRGSFGTFNGTLVIDERHPKKSTLDMTVDVSSIDTKSKKRDLHLQSPEFFDVEKYPTMRFTNLRVVGGGKLRKNRHAKFGLEGDLTIRDVTKRVKFKVDYIGSASDTWGNDFASFSATATINRKEFGLKWNKVVDSGTLLVGERVYLEIYVAAKKVKPGDVVKTTDTTTTTSSTSTSANSTATSTTKAPSSGGAATPTTTAPGTGATQQKVKGKDSAGSKVVPVPAPPAPTGNGASVVPSSAANMATSAVKSGVQAVKKSATTTVTKPSP